MYTTIGAWDWSELSQLAYATDHRRLGSRFPIELGTELILSPHLYGWSDAKPSLARGLRDHRDRTDAFTLSEQPVFVLYVARSEDHRRFLEGELAPALPRDLAFLVVDPVAESFAPSPTRPASPLAELPGYLGRLMKDEGMFERAAFDVLRSPWGASPKRLASAPTKIDAEHARAIEAAPVRLWETFLWRGHAHRWELVSGEVPLVGVLPTALAANRALLSCVRDAEVWTGVRATEARGWIEVEHFRFRQLDTTLEIRARLSPADVRVGFMPVHEKEGSDELPTLAGVLIAGGDNGKVEWINGYNWSTIMCEIPGEAPRLARELEETLHRLGAPRVDVTGCEEDSFPDHDDGRWVIQHDDRELTLFMPLYRDENAALYALRGG